MFDKRGRLSLFRVAVLGAVIGAVLIGFGIVALNNDQNSRRSPLLVEPYPGSEQWGELVQETATNVRFFLRARNIAPEQVAAYYQTRLSDFANGERCVRTPADGSLPTNPDQPNSIPYRFDCMFDRSSRSATQYTRVSIFPEMPGMDPYTDETNNTIITYQQVWQP
ncbi:MAG: hypothetical protein SF162_05480 [bacterium]|nr:hypothetical protein [bacterium]